jgi:transcriptional regulator
MYIPPYFRNENTDELLAFMKAHPLAVICCNGEKIPSATHLPFTISVYENKINLISHFAVANPHSKELKEGDDVLVIFKGQDAYISPSLYEKKENVPTWNYMAVHASGKYRALNTEEEKEKTVLAMIEAFDPAYLKQWKELSPKYTSGMLKGIIAFEIEVEGLEGKFKLSQNKTLNEQEKIAASLLQNELSSTMKENISPRS